MAMKNMQPVEVIPMLGSFPVSPTSLNWKVISIAGTSTDSPVLSVTNTRTSLTSSTTGSSIISSLPKHPDNDIVTIKATKSKALPLMAEAYLPLFNRIAIKTSSR